MEKLCKFFLMNDWIGYPLCILGQHADRCSCNGDTKKCTNNKAKAMRNLKVEK